MLIGTPYILYQPEFSVLLSDCFHMSFQLGVVFCSSQEIRGFPCQETANWMPELEFNSSGAFWVHSYEGWWS